MKTTKRKREPAAAAPAVTAEPVQSETSKAAPVLALASNCGVKDAAELKKSLCKLAQESDSVAIDVSSLERVDTATMQLLCAFVRERQSQDRKFEWLGASPALQDAARLLGVTELLALAPGAHTDKSADKTNQMGAAA